MALNQQLMGCTVYGAQRNGDGSFECDVVILQPSPIAGGMPEVIGKAHIRVNSDKVCEALASALRQLADQIPPALEMPGSLQ